MNVTPENFQTLVLDAAHAIVDFSSPWCAPCRALEAALTQAERERPGLTVLHVDIGAHPSLAQTYGVRSTPTLVAFRAGQPVDMEVGYAGPHRLARFLDRASGPTASPATLR